MSTPPTPGTPAPTPPVATPTQPTPPAPVAPHPHEKKEIRIVSHSSLFYWWPVWALGFLFALITLMSHQRMVPVDRKAEYHAKAVVTADGKTLENRSVWSFDKVEGLSQEKIRISPNKNLGVLFCIILLLVIAITNIPLRGLWSVIAIVFIISFSIIFALLGWWEHILEALSILDIRINFEGYLLISTVLFVLWLIVFLLFDKQIYMIFSPGQLRVRLEIGEAETAYDSTGMTIQKQRSDLFRHWILGIGSGDLIVRTTGAQSHL